MFEELFDTSKNGVAIIDRNGLVLRINPAGCRELRTGADTLTGQCLVPEEGRTDLLNALEEATATSGWVPFRLAPPGRSSDPSAVTPFKAWAKLLRAQTDSPQFAIDLTAGKRESAIFRELRQGVQRSEERIAHEVRLQTALKDSNSKLRLFAHQAAHELKAPLAQIEMCLDRGVRFPDDPRQQRKWQGLAKTAAGHLSAMVDDLLDFANLPQSAVEKMPTRLEKIIVEAAALAGASPSKPPWLAVEALPVLKCDGSILRIVFKALFENAVKFQSADRPLAVSVSAMDLRDRKAIVVEDNGAGFDPRMAERIFEPFSRAAAHSGIVGFGIGLATCRELIDAHGWTIQAEGYPGRGAVFIITAPPEDFISW